ncbi:hypothetical protein ACWCXH_22480 [Kitasatospora sp. NPDC001660]
MFPIRRSQSPAAPTAAGLPSDRQRDALLATDLQDVPLWRRATPAFAAIVVVGLADLLSGKERYLAPLMTVVPVIAALTLKPGELLVGRTGEGAGALGDEVTGEPSDARSSPRPFRGRGTARGRERWPWP